MTITINGVDYTTSVIAPSVKIDKEANYQNDIAITIRTNDQIRAGMEIIVTDGADTVFGGLLQTPKRMMESPSTLLQSVASSGYKQILARRSFEINDTNQVAGDRIQNLFDRFLKVGGTDTTEDLILGQIDSGATIARKKGIFNGYKLFTDYAESSGYRWWIQPDKKFYFTDVPTYTAATKEITDTPGAPDTYFKLFEYPDFEEDLSKYRTRQYVIGKDDTGAEIIGLAINETEETRMAALYGSGVYGNIVYDDNLKTQAECDASAQALLDANSEAPQFLTIKTRDFIDVNQTVNVTLSAFGLSSDEFIVSSVSVRYDKTEKWLYYEAKLRKALDTASAQSSWTDDFNRGLTNRQKEGIVSRTSDDSELYVQPNEPQEADSNDFWDDTDDKSTFTGPDITLPYVALIDDGEIAHVVGGGTYTALDITTSLTGALDPNAELYQVVHNDDPLGGANIIINSATGDTFNGAATITVTPQQSALMWGRKGKTDWTVRVI